MVGVHKHLGCQNESLLIATAGHAPNVYKSARNIQKVAVQAAADLNAFSVLSARRLVITTEALDQIKQRAVPMKWPKPKTLSPSA